MLFDSLTPPDVVIASLIEPLAGIDLSDGLFTDVDNIPDVKSPLLSLDTETGCSWSDRLAVPLDVGTLTGVFVPELAELVGAIVSSSTLAKAVGCVLNGRLVCAEISGTELAIFADLPLLSLDTETGCSWSDGLAVPLDVRTLTSVFVLELAELLGAIVSSSTLAKAAGCVLNGRLVCAEISGTELAIFADEDIRSGSSFAAARPCFSFATVDDPDRASPELRPVSARFGISPGEVFCSLLWGATAIRREANSPLGKADCDS
jgi:hypothetical protein